MSISMYEASAPRFVSMLQNLDAILAKAQTHATAKKIDPEVLAASRLYPDMFPLTRQVQIACDHAKGACGRLAGVELPKFEDQEKTLDDLRERIAKTLAFIATVKPEQIDGSEDKSITLKVGGEERSFVGKPYLIGFSLPTFYFHVVTAYNILRHNGVEIGKRDYLPLP